MMNDKAISRRWLTSVLPEKVRQKGEVFNPPNITKQPSKKRSFQSTFPEPFLPVAHHLSLSNLLFFFLRSLEGHCRLIRFDSFHSMTSFNVPGN